MIKKTILTISLLIFSYVSASFILKIIKTDNLFTYGMSITDPTKAIFYLEQADAEFGQFNFNVTSLLATKYIQLKQYDKAIETYSKSLRSHPNNVNAMLNLGYCYLQTGDLDQAEHWFKEVLKITPKSFKAFNNLSLVYQSKGNYQQSVKTLQEGLKHNPDHVDSLMNLANLYMQLEKGTDAIDTYKRILEITPDDNVREKLSQIYYSWGNMEKAWEFAPSNAKTTGE